MKTLDETLIHLTTTIIRIGGENIKHGDAAKAKNETIKAMQEANQAILTDLLALPELQDEPKLYPENAKNMHENRTIRIRNHIRSEVRQALTAYVMGEGANT